MTGGIWRSPRYAIAVDADARIGKVVEQAVHVTNLSASGCRFVSPFRRLVMGTPITLTFGRSGVIAAKVRWRIGETHGVRFLQPLQPAMLDHIRLFLSEKPAFVAERDGSAA